MSEDKLSSIEVPQKLTEWLLKMGCPPEKVPPLDKITQMCRGQYYMVWRSMMEHVKPKDIIKDRRMQVFCDDVFNYEQRNVFNERGNNKVVPEEIILWRQQKELHEKVCEAEQSLATKKQALNVLLDEINRKALRRNTLRQSLQSLQRKIWQLTLAAEEWRSKITNLEETKTIADSLCHIKQENGDLKNKLDRCLSVFARPASSKGASTSLLATNPVACSSVVSTTPSDHSDEEHIASLVQCGPGLWSELYERRAALTQKLIAGNTAQETIDINYSVTPQWIISQTICLQSSLALEAMKHRVYISNTRKRLAVAVSELNNILTSAEARELLVLKCESACANARLVCLRELLEEVTSQRGNFRSEDRHEIENVAPGQIAQIDKAIVIKKDELKRLVCSLSVTERKILNVRECLLSVFNAFYKDTPNQEIANYKGVQLDLPQESLYNIRRYYEERSRNTNKMELSMNLDISNISNDNIDSKNLRLQDELRFYMKNFNLDKNRKLVLESGEKIWIFETLGSSLNKLMATQQDESLPQLINASTNVAHCLNKIIEGCKDRSEMEQIQKKFLVETKLPIAMDIKIHEQKEEEIHDKIKKRLNDNLNILQKTNKTINLGIENLQFWKTNNMNKYISNDRRINGKSYQDYEVYYLENLC